MTKLKQNIKIVLGVLFVLLFTINFKVTAQTKNTIEFKTSIINQSESPMPDGSYNFRFAIYNSQTGGTALWSEDRTGVPVRKAAVSVQLGSIVPFPQNLFKNTSLYLQICLDANLAGGDGSGECAGSFEENFKPRKVMTAAPWAFNATSLGPVTVTQGQTAYDLNTFGSDSTLLNLRFNDAPKFSVNSLGTVKITEDSDIYFGDNISLRNSASAETAGANMIGVSTAGLQNITGNTLQSVLTNIDPLLRWKANGSSVFYNGGNVGIGTNAPAFALDVIGTGNFTNGIILGDNTNATAGAVRFAAGTFEGYDGVSWIPFAGSALSPWLSNGTSLYYNLGNVGIGTATPARALEVNGALRLDTIAQPGAPVSGDIYSSGAALFYYNGSGWVNMTNDATTDNGAGMTYVTNVANSFGIGGTTAGAAPFVFDPISGALIKRNTTIQNDPATAMPNLLTLDSSGANAQVGGNKNGITGNFAYTPNGGNGTQIYNTQESTLVINSGDGTAIDRARGYRNTIVNNSSGLVGGVFNISTINTNNGTLEFQTGTNSLLQNNGTLTGQMTALVGTVNNSGDAGGFMIGTSSHATNNVGGVTDQLTAGYFQTTNNGTTDYQYGTRNVVENNGTINIELEGALNGSINRGTSPTTYGFNNSAFNDVAGITNDVIGIRNVSDNSGNTVNVTGIYNSVGNTGTASGLVVGMISSNPYSVAYLNYDNQYALYTTGLGVKFSNQAIVGNSTGTDEAGAIRFDGVNFQGYDGTTWGNLGAGAGSTQWSDNGADIYFNSGAVGIGQVNDGSFLLEVAGAGQFGNEVVVGDSLADTAGAIRWTGTDFEGYDGTSWVSFTSGGAPASETPPVFDTSSFATDASTGNFETVFMSPTGTDRLMVASIHYRDATQTVQSVAFNGSSFTKACSSQQDDYAVEVWYLTNPAATGNNVEVTWTAPVPDRAVGAATFTNVSQTSPINSSLCNTSPGGIWDTTHSITVTSDVQDLVYGAASSYSGDNNLALAPAGAFSNLYDALSGNVIGNGAYGPSDAGVSTTITWNGTSSGPTAWPWSAGAVSIHGVGGTGGGGSDLWQANGSDIYYTAGLVGINDATPSYNLDVNGVARITNQIIVGNSFGTDEAGAIRFNGSNFEGYDGATWNALDGAGGGNQWTNDGFDNIYYNMGTVGIGGFATGETFTVQGTSYLNGNVGIGTNPSGTYGLLVNGTTHLQSDLRVSGAATIGTGGDPGGFYSLEVTGDALFNDRIGINVAPDNLFALNILGDVNISGNLYVQNGGICADGGSGCPGISPGGIYGDLAYAEFDVAENILANQDVEAGDIVSVLEGQQEVVRKTSIANESTVLGIISTNPGSLGGYNLQERDGFKKVPLVLSGRVPVKVTNENGAIAAGDAITSSSTPGVAMKATLSKTKIVGYAMQSYDANGVGKIIVMYQPGYLP